MARLKFSERIRITHLAADRLRRGAISSVLYSPPFRWQFGASAAEQLLIVPQDLRTADPSFWDEVEIGQFGLAGAVALADDVSPFDVIPPSEAWECELHGFGWLRHLAAAARPEARETARLLAAEWAMRHRGNSGGGLAWEPHVTGRRLISWISHSALLLEDADAETYEIITESLGVQLVRLAASWRNSPSGYPRLLSLLSLLLAQLCISGHEGQVAETEKLFVQELDRQILSDGGHIGRNPGVL
ncbi:MAG TPA: heparinase, partial [Hyphomicrobium zavarzinii]|nr:heparinase [Hyphomicrobium zavarzinii]